MSERFVWIRCERDPSDNLPAASGEVFVDEAEHWSHSRSKLLMHLWDKGLPSLASERPEEAWEDSTQPTDVKEHGPVWVTARKLDTIGWHRMAHVQSLPLGMWFIPPWDGVSDGKRRIAIKLKSFGAADREEDWLETPLGARMLFWGVNDVEVAALICKSLGVEAAHLYKVEGGKVTRILEPADFTE